MAFELKMNGWISVPWAEYISRAGGTQDARLSYQSGCSAVYVIDVNWSDYVQAIEDILGVHWYDPATGLLSRTPAVQHPIFDTLYAASISSIRQVSPKQKAPMRGGRGQTSYAKLARITISFEMPSWWRTLSDGDLDKTFPPVAGKRAEWMRYVYYQPTATTETISHKPGEFVYTEAGPGGANPAVGEKLTLQQAQHVTRTDLRLKWCLVPARPGLFSSATDQPVNLIVNQNKINNATFLGYAAGTLLFKGYSLEPAQNPAFATYSRLNKLGQTPLLYNVNLDIIVKDPRPGGATRGHNLAPHIKGRWYECAYGGVGGERLLDTFDMTTLFQLPG